MTKWEYATIQIQKKWFGSGMSGNEEFNELGIEGWELVSVIPMQAQLGLTGATTGGIAFFKRELK